VCQGAWLVVGNQESKTVVSFAVDAASGSLRFAHELSTAPYKPCNISPYALSLA
jgi:6-phosphogluconolactonase (cycloisomerase 2 family)